MTRSNFQSRTAALAVPAGTASRQLAHWRLAAGSVMLVGAMLASTTAFNAWAAPAAEAPAERAAHSQHQGHGHGHHHGHGHGKHGGPGGMFFGGRMLDRLLDDVKATDAQRTQIRQIADAARADLRQLHENAPKLREQGLALLTQPQVDAAAAERVRQQMVAQHDAASKRMTTAMVQIAQVLTPEQRAQLATKLKERQAKWEQRRAQRAERGQPGQAAPR